MDDVLVAELSVFRSWSRKRALRILEVGVARSTADEYRVGDGWSSVSFAHDVRDFGGSLTGVDLDVSAARELLAGEGLVEELIEGDSRDVLRRLGGEGRRFDVVFLDGANDAEVVLEEFWLVEELGLVDGPGVIIADDMDMNDPEVVKGHLLIPHLQETGRAFRMTYRETPWCRRDILVMNVV
ncbi:class I SAM-dependent methyltransferase [Rhodococcus qingshengii]|uniref:class I SAM-dependent methyltransferase n=1 Tax=Rhodococcus qingshengii TaxID=334542 RepID=UPI0035DF600A